MASHVNKLAESKMQLKAKLYYKQFNAVAAQLLSELANIYPNDLIIRTISDQLKLVQKKPELLSMGAGVFFQEVNKPACTADGRTCTYVELLAAHSDDSFLPNNIPVSILKTVGMCEKWQKMSSELKEAIWKYVDRLVECSTMGMIHGSQAQSERAQLCNTIIQKMDGQPADLHKLMADPAVQQKAMEYIEATLNKK